MKKHLLLMAGIAIAANAAAQWGTSVDDPLEVFPPGTGSYATEVKAAPDGSVWALIYHPNLRNAAGETDTQNVVYEYILQHFDPNGNETFPGGMLISDYKNISYTVVNDYLLVDKDGNAIVSVIDNRNSGSGGRSYTAYKVSPTGEMLWGEDGVAVSDALNPAPFGTCMRMVQLEDGSFVFAWQEMDDNYSAVRLQRISNDGKPMWDLNKTTIEGDVNNYPYLVNSGDNTFILVYGKSASSVMYARKMDFEAESVWGKDVRIYRGGWGSTPLHTKIDVQPSGDGGVLVAWCDDRNSTNIETPYLSYVTTDGKLGFAGQSDEADVKLTYDNWRSFNVATTAAADGSGFYVIWRHTDTNQGFQGIMMQKVDKEGELLWGDNPPEMYETAPGSLSYLSIQPTEEGGACGFFMKYYSYFEQEGIAVLINSNGDFLWDDNGAIKVTPGTRATSSLKSQPYGEKSWLLNWTDNGTSAEDKETTYMMNILDDDGNFGKEITAVESVKSDKGSIRFNGESLLLNAPDGTGLNIFDTTGSHIGTLYLSNGKAEVKLPSGIYFAVTTEGSASKFIVNN